MATVQGWISETRAHLLTGLQENRNVLASPYTAGGTTGDLTFSYTLTGIIPGVRLSIGLATYHVLSVNSATSTATVLTAQEGTTDANAAAGALVRIAPRFTDNEIFTALRYDLGDLSAPDNGLFVMRAVDLTYSSSAVGYDLGTLTNLIDIYDVRAQGIGTAKDWPRVAKSDWRFDSLADTTTFPSGLALQLFGTAYAGLKVKVLYRAGFTVPTATTDDQATTGLPATAYDLPPLGAALRLAAPREIRRNFNETQGDTRRAGEVPPGAIQASYRGLAGLRAQRVQAEAYRLSAQWPDRRW